MSEQGEQCLVCGKAPLDLSEPHAVGHVCYERAPSLDKRISRGDDFAGDAWVRWVAVGHRPDDQSLLAAPDHAEAEIERLRLILTIAGIDPDAAPHPCDGDDAIDAAKGDA